MLYIGKSIKCKTIMTHTVHTYLFTPLPSTKLHWSYFPPGGGGGGEKGWERNIAVFRIPDPGFFAVPDPGFKSPDPSINKPMGSK